MFEFRPARYVTGSVVIKISRLTHPLADRYHLGVTGPDVKRIRKNWGSPSASSRSA